MNEDNPEQHSVESATLRECRPEDISELIAESDTAFLASTKHPNETTTEKFMAFKGDPNFALYVLEVDGRPVSYISALSHTDSSTIAIGPMYVSKDFRGLGFGLRQVEEFIDMYRTKGYMGIFTRTWGANAASKGVFERLGFSLVGTKSNDRVDGDDTLEYLLQI